MSSTGRAMRGGSCTMVITTLPGSRRSLRDRPMLVRSLFTKAWWALSMYQFKVKPVITTKFNRKTTNLLKWDKHSNQAQRMEHKSAALIQFCAEKTTSWTIPETINKTLWMARIRTLATRVLKASAKSCRAQEKLQERLNLNKFKQKTLKMIIIMTKHIKRALRTLKNLRWMRARKTTYSTIMDKI